MAERAVQHPVSVSAGTTYVASYFAPNGHYFGQLEFLRVGLHEWAIERPGRKQRHL